MDNWEEIDDNVFDNVFDVWQEELFSLQSDVQTTLSTMLQGDELMTRDAILTCVGLCRNIIDDLDFLDLRVQPDFPWCNKLKYMIEIVLEVVVDILTNLEAMFDKLLSAVEEDKNKRIHPDNN